MKKTLNIATVFSGIGAFEQALLRLNVDHNILFACDNGEIDLNKGKEELIEEAREHGFKKEKTSKYVAEQYKATGKTNWMKKSYLANYKIDEKNFFEDIRFIDGTKFKNKVDIFVGGSPCQSFSMIGKRAGLEDARGTLFFEYARLVNEMKPKVFIYENVPGMLNHDKGNTWKVISEIFESLDYKLNVKVLNAMDYGIPQDRKRLFVVGFKNKKINFEFPQKLPLETTMFDYLEPKPEVRHYLGKKGFEFVTNPKYEGRARVNKNVIQTQKANQQFNWNGDFVFEKLAHVQKNKEILNRAYVGEWNGEKGVIRQLTYRECLRLMGFADTFKIITPNVWSYRHAGNSIVVNVLENIVKKILEVEFV